GWTATSGVAADGEPSPDADPEPAPAEPVGDLWLDVDDGPGPSATIPPQPVSPPPPDAQPASPQPAAPPPPGSGFAEPASGGTVDFDDGEASNSIFDDVVLGDVPVDTAGTEGDASAAAGILVFSNGVRIAVDRNVLIGRNPKVPGEYTGGLPHLMKFDGPGQGLSRTHAEVRLEGGEMWLEDLDSTNGTEVQLPGQQRRRMRAGEPVVVVPGTLIDFGEELHCTVEPAG
ncbi:FHA domain-containing protein, partial [Ilumatobacter sp.]|uniref:FHA domain-containing protein n=1 Tax=Ilumatobacter sp. TaxID=1967498 RepID=UPI003C44201D